MKIRLLPYQHELRDALRSNSVVVVEKSRRTGYSWAASWIATECAVKPKEDGGMNVYYMGYNLEMAREFIEYVGESAKYLEKGAAAIGETLFQDDGDPENQIKAFRADFRCGRVVALPSRPRSLRGMQGLVILDEAAFHDDLEELLKAALALTVWGGKVLIISTHDGDDNPFNQLIQDCRSGKLPYTVLRCDFDRAIEEGLYRRVCERTGETWTKKGEIAWRQRIIDFYGDGADEELFCIPARSGGAYLVRNIIEANMDKAIPVLTWAPPAADFVDWPEDVRWREVDAWCTGKLLPVLDTLDKRLPHWFGEDFARLHDLTSLWFIAQRRDMSWATPFVVELRDTPYRQQEQVLFYAVDRLPRLSGGALDKGGNGGFLAEVARQRYGGPDVIHEIQLSPTWYQNNMPPLKAALEDRTFPLPSTSDVLDDMRAIKVTRGIPMVPRDSRSKASDGNGKRHGDSAIAAALALYAARTITPGSDWAYASAGSGVARRITHGYGGRTRW